MLTFTIDYAPGIQLVLEPAHNRYYHVSDYGNLVVRLGPMTREEKLEWEATQNEGLDESEEDCQELKDI